VIPHGRNDDGNAITALAHRRNLGRDTLDEFHRTHRGAAVFLDNGASHDLLRTVFSSVKRTRHSRD
jgi:hypothetical protein